MPRTTIRRCRAAAGDPLPDAAGDLSALSGAHARAGAGALLCALLRRDLRAELPSLTLPLFLVLLIGALAYLKYGPSERTMSTPPLGVAGCSHRRAAHPRYRNDVCFLFLDGGSDNMRGAKGFRKRYPSAKEKPVLCPRLRGQRRRAADPCRARAPAGTASCSTRSIRALKTRAQDLL